jgi:hypothetical protein
MGEVKRFMAYEIVKRLKKQGELALIKVLTNGVQKEERLKGKKHQVFRLSFDAKEVKGGKEIDNVLDYIHHNPVSGKWQIVADFVDYPYSSAKYYEQGIQREIEVCDHIGCASEAPTDDLSSSKAN